MRIPFKVILDGALLSKLPSSQVAMNWAVSHLFVQARARKRVVICMRATKRWGLTSGNHDGWLFAPRVTRGGHMFNDENRQLIVDAAKEALTMPNERQGRAWKISWAAPTAAAGSPASSRIWNAPLKKRLRYPISSPGGFTCSARSGFQRRYPPSGTVMVATPATTSR
jgi:hypothetical protein